MNAQHFHNHEENDSRKALEYIENLGQWNDNILYQSKIKNGAVFLESNCLTFTQISPEDLGKLDDLVHQEGEDWKNIKMNMHAWKVYFQNANLKAVARGDKKMATYHNYFIGNDQSSWKGNVPLFENVKYESLYDNIDLKTYCDGGNFKYDFIVHPNGNADEIELMYEGLDGIKIEKGNLILQTSVGVFTEIEPYAYQVIDGKKVQVKCEYKLNDNTLSFDFPDEFNKNYTLVIDPTLIGSTLSGTVGGSNYGHAATYDDFGNIYSAARNFSVGYPATSGAFQNVAAGMQDIAISKLSPNASTLIYATHLGGSSNDLPHSMFVSSANELYILGSTSSANFPTLSGCFSKIFGGAIDIIVTHFNAAGSGVIGSTFVGGSNMDGINYTTSNYGDNFRGEIIVDALGDCYVASGTMSTNFPITTGAYQTSLGGSGDAVVFKMNSTLTTMYWGTFIGGTGSDFGLGLRLDNSGDVYVCGAADQGFMIGTGYQPTHAGLDDGFIVKLTGNGSTVSASTFVGTSANDNAFFIDLDDAGKVYVYGQTSAGTMTATAGTYNVPLSRQYINRFDPTLVTRDISSLIGSGSVGGFVPIAFMVDNCGFIYFSGHSAGGSSLPLSPNAIQTVGGIYIGVLEPDALGLHYATHYGGVGDHTDGGTSRFDPSGIIYQSVCTSSGFNTTLGAYSSTYPMGFDIGVFKIAFEAIPIGASASFTTNTNYCVPLTATFVNNSVGASYLWDFGDGSPIDTSANPVHVYTTSGTYTVMLVANDSNSCFLSDTAYYTVVVPSPFSIDLGPDIFLCSGTDTLIPNFSGANYLWQDGSTDSMFVVSAPGTYYVTVTVGPCVANDTIEVSYLTVDVDLGADDFICTGDSVILDAGNLGATYLWSDSSTAQTLVVNTTGTYWVLVNGTLCSDMDTINVSAEPLLNLGMDTILCSGLINLAPNLSVSSTTLWQDGSIGPIFQVYSSGIYYVTVTTNSCVSTDTIEVTYLTIDTDLGPDLLLCSGDEVTLDAGVPGSTYLWSDNSNGQTLQVSAPGNYWVIVNNTHCSDSDAVVITEETFIPGFNVLDTTGCIPMITYFMDTTISSASIVN
ncbi:MAG: PKD domain-containing protein, partial [Bacteroidota bacterium]